ncbi:unnamed protein product [Paramecium octaurelia]|uniref:Uncharacterized protein n=1 Tax=Paramecium octaurelia TaxID=43137 RepID=A0A8S1THP4_PAROT|nr:unnamed protein product [Paramecium octaurelia]
MFSSFLRIQDFAEYFYQEKIIILGLMGSYYRFIPRLYFRINYEQQRCIEKIEKDIKSNQQKINYFYKYNRLHIDYIVN